MKIKKYQTGGIYYTPFFRDSVIPQAESQNYTRTTSKEDKEDSLIQKEIISVLKENGLPNDVDYFLEKANRFLNKSRNLGTIFNSGKNSSYDMSDLIKITSLANRVKYNNGLHEQATKQIIDEGSGSEVAITNTGNLYVLDEKEGLKTITLDTYYKNPNKYVALTNSELLQFRETHPQLAYNSTILSDLSGTVGMKSIVDYVKSTISSFGTNKSSNQFDRYTTKQKGKIEQGFEQLLGFDSPEGIYNVTTKTVSSDQGYNDEESLNAAVNYLYKTLPGNMKNVLRANATAEGLNPNSAKDVQHLLAMAIQEHTSHSREVEQSIDYDSTASKAAGTNGTDGSGKFEDLTREEMIVNGKTTDVVKRTIRNSNSKVELHFPAQEYDRPQDTTHKQIGMGTILDIMTKDPLGNNVDLASVSFGGQALNETDVARVLYDGVSNYNRALLPIDKNEFINTGRIVPDFDATARFEKFIEWLNNGNGVMPNSITSKLRELNLDIYLGDDGQWHFNDERLFILLNGYASDTIVNIDSSTGWLDKVDSNQAERIYDNYLRHINYGTDQPSKGLIKRANESRSMFTIEKNHLYKGIIAMPLNDPAIATVTTGHEKVPQEAMIDILNRRRMLEEERGIKTQF